MKMRVLSIFLLVVSIVLTVVSFLLLPAVVTTQLSLGGGSATEMPRLFAILIPALLSVGGAAVCVFGKNSFGKALTVSVVGILVFVIMLVVNL